MRNIGKSSGAASVVLVGLDGDQMGTVRETLAAEAVLPNSSVPFGDALPVIERTRPDVVIVGYMRSIEASKPPSWTHGGMDAFNPVAPAGYV